MTSVYERLKNLQITLPGVPPPRGGWLRYCFRSVCPDRQSDSFVGAARKEEWKALVRQVRFGFLTGLEELPLARACLPWSAPNGSNRNGAAVLRCFPTPPDRQQF